MNFIIVQDTDIVAVNRGNIRGPLIGPLFTAFIGLILPRTSWKSTCTRAIVSSLRRAFIYKKYHKAHFMSSLQPNTIFAIE